MPVISNVRLPRMKTTGTTLKHPGTGRTAVILRVRSLLECEPFELRQRSYVLVLASAKDTAVADIDAARAWIDAGARYVCAWGPASEIVEETFDYAAFMPQVGEPLSYTLMTTSHREEELDDALWFAFYNGKAPHEESGGQVPVVVVVDSPELEKECIKWIRANSE